MIDFWLKMIPQCNKILFLCTNSAAAAASERTKRAPWWKCLFCHCEKKEDDRSKESTSDSTAAVELSSKVQKSHWWHRLLRCCKRRHRVAPSPEEEEPQGPVETQSNAVPQEADVVQCEEPVALFGGQGDTMADTSLLAELLNPDTILEQTVIEALIREQVSRTTRSGAGRGDAVKRSTTTTTDRFGFPNIGQTCYLSSCLQSLLTLEDFIRDLSSQEQVWTSVPKAQLIRRLMAIRDVHTSTDSERKGRLLRGFMKALSVQAPEFGELGNLQKDAHEFLTSVLDQIRSLSPHLQVVAASTGRRYTCPVDDHLVFRMEHTRTCKRCGLQSTRQEEFSNLSLDLVPGGSVEDMLQDYVEETELEFRCECGGNTSGQRSAFVTLPRVLVLHLKRFRFTPAFQQVKVHDPVGLLRDMVVSSNQDAGCYSLVSAISHFGSTGEAGHYICDSVHPDDCPDEPTDRWLTFNDSWVNETTGESVCEQRQESAYILFYKRQV
ncbi:ubiquitin carboxyl-terminal hydrolase 37-like [Morone saxatilis]|uniref:ubiquitin carboxyl-terminal hydrolase 37-like n=1 Tax=Morone saxatilis TaxID=34816 RepID=UPI0015E1F863|nr:ubiquitin carboxyl-terminal hydrolase 37-like [Morone saxatilis]